MCCVMESFEDCMVHLMCSYILVSMITRAAAVWTRCSLYSVWVRIYHHSSYQYPLLVFYEDHCQLHVFWMRKTATRQTLITWCSRPKCTSKVYNSHISSIIREDGIIVTGICSEVGARLCMHAWAWGDGRRTSLPRKSIHIWMSCMHCVFNDAWRLKMTVWRAWEQE